MSHNWPKMYRTMLPEDSSTSTIVPSIGAEKNMLGVIIGHDVHPDENGCISPNDEGLSVAPSFAALPNGLVPERLRHKRRGARGNDNARVFRAGSSSFVRSPIGDRLELKPTSNKHGVLQPKERTHVDVYQRSLAATRPHWTVDEE